MAEISTDRKLGLFEREPQLVHYEACAAASGMDGPSSLARRIAPRRCRKAAPSACSFITPKLRKQSVMNPVATRFLTLNTGSQSGVLDKCLVYRTRRFEARPIFGSLPIGVEADCPSLTLLSP